MKEVVFVCTGNTCRSPMAESIFKTMVKRTGVECKVLSRGLCINPQETEINEKAKEVLKKNNYKVPTKKAQKITPKIIKEASIVVTMTESQKELLVGDIKKSKLEGSADYINKIYSIKELVNGIDIPDPYGYGEAEYEAVFKVLFASLDRLYKRLFSK